MVESWTELHPFLEHYDWKYTFILSNIVAKETYLQSFQYKVVNRILNCNYNLHKWGIKISPACIYCNYMDTITHHLFECEEVKSFWNHVQLWILEKLGVKFSFTICEIISGISNPDDLMKAVNYIILCSKSYINKQRSLNKKLASSHFICNLKEKIKVVLTIEKINKCNEHFSNLFELLIV